MQDKNELLEFGGGERKKEKNLDYKVLATAYLGLFMHSLYFCLKFTSQIKFITSVAKSAI